MAVERMCLGGRVRLVFDVGRMPRPDTSHNANWVRQHAGGSQDHVVSFITQRPSYRVNQRGNVITVSITLNLPNLYVAQELTQYPPAVMAAVLQHERGHVPEWGRVMSASLADIATELGGQISPPQSATPDRVRIVRSFVSQWELICRQAADTWDRSDYPQLHQVLRRANVNL